jgi:hypothetical protein
LLRTALGEPTLTVQVGPVIDGDLIWLFGSEHGLMAERGSAC